MRALSIRQPWAHAVLYLGKRVENRTWATAYRGPLALHAGKRFVLDEIADDWAAVKASADPALFAAHPKPFTLAMLRAETGGFVGTARLADCIPPGGALPAGQGDWYAGGGQFAWVLDDVAPLPALVPWRGVLGLFDVLDAVLRGGS